jgi:anti-sigma factor RsiW
MNCKKIREKLPLMAGDDLSLKQARVVRSHLKECRECRQELERYTHPLGETRDWLSQEIVSWEEAEWRQIVKKAIQPRETRKIELAPWPFRPVWAWLAMLLFTAVISLVLLKPVPSGKDILLQNFTAEEEFAGQQIVAVTLVSKESGIKINWFLNKNFNLEEEIE